MIASVDPADRHDMSLDTLIPEGARTLADLGSGAGFPGLVLAALLARGREPRLGESDERTDSAKTAPAKLALRDGLHVFRYPAYVLHSLALVFFYTAMSVQIWIPAFLHRGFGLTNQQASGFLAQALLYTLPVGIVGGWLSSLTLRRFRWGFPLFLSLTSIAASAAFYLGYTAPDLRSAQVGIVAAIYHDDRNFRKCHS